ncbi:MAG: nickel-dependent hydrogenase large subunit [Polyangiaceae bacterium]|jgi:coenzyme F420-reducing hydrogenase alpha subunit
MRTRTIKVDIMARVEGEAALTVRMRGDEVVGVELRIFEPPRLFEALLRGRSCFEAPDVTARICGICPVAYQMSACAAVENALGANVSTDIAALRRLLYCGEWIESHVLHMIMLHAPDFLGVDDAIAMARLHPERVRAGLRMKKAGNAIVSKIGGREIHPINVRVGGFYRPPTKSELESLLPELRWARDAAAETIDWVGGFEFPAVEHAYDFVSLRHPERYPFCEGRIASTSGLDIDVSEYDAHFVESQVPYSHALQTTLDGKPIFCGPLARFHHNFDRLPSIARAAAERVGLVGPCQNPYKSILVRGIEVLFALDEAIGIIERYVAPVATSTDPPSRAGMGWGCTEAPRGILVHRYTLDETGAILDAKIVPPTSQNQRTIEDDLARIGKELAALPLAAARARAERAVRNYDPCISCATHFLDLRFESIV